MEKITFKDLPNTDTPINSSNLNSLQANIENAISEIIESGTNTNGSYIKYSDGTMICRGTKAILLDINNAWGETLYTGSYTDEITFPHAFISAPDLTYNCNPSTATGFFYGSIVDGGLLITTTGFSGVTLIRPNSRTNVNAKVNFIAIGKWK